MEVVEMAGAEMALGAQEREAEAVTAQEPMEVVVRDSVVRVRAEGERGWAVVARVKEGTVMDAVVRVASARTHVVGTGRMSCA